jgi:transitional endoplasmic reticulum ATPase
MGEAVMVEVRTAGNEDRDTVMRLWEESGLGSTRVAEWSTITAGSCARLLVAELDGTVRGAGVASYDGWRAFIYHLAVAKEYRRHGIATAILAEAEADLKRRGAEQIFALVNQSNTDGLALAAANGYEPEGDIAFIKLLS